MSKHERQHSVSNASSSNENPIREVKRARLENENSSSPTMTTTTNNNWSTTLYVNTKIKDEQPTGFSSCFLTDQLLMPDPKKSHIEKSEYEPFEHQFEEFFFRSLIVILPILVYYNLFVQIVVIQQKNSIVSHVHIKQIC